MSAWLGLITLVRLGCVALAGWVGLACVGTDGVGLSWVNVGWVWLGRGALRSVRVGSG